MRSALNAGKSVVTANKQLIARHGPDLLQLASANGCQLEFGASVAGGVPVLPALRTGLCGDRLHGIAGILNGTCNYILSRIETDRIPFSEALEEAQARGYAEADASEDLDGGDARAKLSILALAGLHVRVSPGDIRARTIRPIDAVDFDYAAELGCTIRQISRADLKETTLFADVGPSLVPASSPFGRVQRNLNLVLTSGEYGGDMAFLGAGAGGDPTAVAVVSDLMFVAESLAAGPRPHRPLQLASPKVSCDFETPWYLRFLVKDQPGIIAGLAAILSAHQLNIDAVLQNPGFDKNTSALRDHPRALPRRATPPRAARNVRAALRAPPMPLSAHSALGAGFAPERILQPGRRKSAVGLASAPESSEIFSSSKRDEGASGSSWQ